MDNPYPIDFTDNGDTIVMRLEEWDGVRTVFTWNADASAADQPRSHMGFSVGRWEGSTLVVTTTDVDYPFFDDVGSPQSPDAVIVERFTLSENDTRLDWQATVTDPVNFTAPGDVERILGLGCGGADQALSVHAAGRCPGRRLSDGLTEPLAGLQLRRFVLEQNRVVAEERLLTELGPRIRHVRQGPDGALLHPYV